MEAVGTLGDVAIALSTKAGLEPEPWQADALRLMMAIRADGNWAADEYAEWIGRQEGKTGGILTPRALAGFLVLGERLVMWSAHLYATAMESFLLARDLLRNLGEPAGPNLIDIDGILVKVNNTNGEEGFERLDTGARWRYLARSKASGRGFTGDTNIIDEAFAFTQAQKAALFPTMTARPNPQAVFASTPPLDSWSGDVMFDLRRRAMSGDPEATEGLAYRDWGDPLSLDELMAMPPEQRKAVLDDRRLWEATCPAIGLGRVSEESIRRLRRSLTDEDFAREVAGMWPVPPSEAGGQIPATSWRSAADGGSQFEGRPVFAIEAAEDRSGASILLAGRRADGRVHVEVFDDRDGLGWVVDRAVELHGKSQAVTFAIDPTSPAGVFIEPLRVRNVPVVEITGREYVQACGGFYDAVMGDRLRHRDQPQLNGAATVAKRRDIGDGAWAWARRRSGGDIRTVVGATLAHHALVSHEAHKPAPAFAFADW